MAVDKLVDSTQLDADLTSVANAIRTKGGTSASLAFPAGFVSAIGAIPTGGGFSADEIADHAMTGTVSLTVSQIKDYAFYGQQIQNVNAPNVTEISAYAFGSCQHLGSIIFPEVLTVGRSFNFAGGTSMGDTNAILVFPKLSSFTGNSAFDRGRFIAIDIGPDLSNLPNDTFYHNTSQQTVGTLILRRTAAAVTASNAACLRGIRDVYVPNDLKAAYTSASNWSTYIGAGTITLHSIEGSIYENAYADGTPIS